MSRNLAPEYGPKRYAPARRPDLPLPLSDARPALGPYWLGCAWWQTVLVDHEWWLTYATIPIDAPPAKLPAHLLDARRLHLIDGVAVHIEDHSTCPRIRPDRCDPFAPHAWHADPHAGNCPMVASRRLTLAVI